VFYLQPSWHLGRWCVQKPATRKERPMKIYCCKCRREVDAHLVSGMTTNTRRPEYWGRKYYQCPHCLNYCLAQKFGNEWRPMASIAAPALRAERQRLHDLFDPVWKNDPNPTESRKGWYRYITIGMNRKPEDQFHFGFLRSFSECKRAESLIKRIYKKQGLKFPKRVI